MTNSMIQSEELGQQFKTSLLNTMSLGRMGLDEVAKAVLFLVSDDSSFVIAIELFVGGGIAQI